MSSSSRDLTLDQSESDPSSSPIKTPNRKTRKSQTDRTCGSPTPINKPSKKDTVDQLRTGLATLGLDTKGKKETLWRRLVRAFNHLGFSSPPKEEAAAKHEETESKGEDGRLNQRYKYFLCFDVEATCRGGKEFNWPNEIIEFPVVLCQYDQGQGKLERIDTFHSYVRPTWRPILTEFCISLTGILQEKVDDAPTFLEVLKMFEEWLEKHQLIDEDRNLRDALWVTDGPWDLRDFVPKQLHITPLTSSPYPPYFLGPYLNLKAAVHAVLSEQWRRKQYALEHPNAPPNSRALSRITTASTLNRKQRDESSKRSGKSFWLGITGMVEALGLGDFEGRAHSGIDVRTFG
ncbi:ribonuclease H-like domain-containing protein [Naematelia encephala]|uniref:Ribonuclease H-like domain-containing protein n=1 Tax=Naematelia encephala TaxID=71784 RepID=A0A1Y2BJ81_9TREE|nr:ribonuclease H-like domain-containing protein [Naematelia encephala]